MAEQELCMERLYDYNHKNRKSCKKTSDLLRYLDKRVYREEPKIVKKLVVDVGSMLIVQYLIFYFVEIRLGEQATFTKFITNNYILTFWIIYLASRIVNCKIKKPRNKK